MNKYFYTLLVNLIVIGTVKAGEWFESGLFRYEILSHIGSGGTVKIIGFSSSTDEDNIESLYIPSEVPTYSYKIVEIGENAFSYTRNLRNVIISNSITKIGTNAFIGCYQLESVSISSFVTEMGSYAFSGCSSLATINIPASVKNMGQGVFQNCSSLLQISLPNSLTTISNSLFKGCTGLTDLIIPNSITEIEDFAFSDCDNILDINLPEGLFSIGNYSFENCKGMKSINIPASTQWIGMNPFKGCSSLESLIMNDNKKYHLYDEVLYENNPLKLIGCPASKINAEVEPLTEIFSYSCFAGCENLEKITIPKTVREICSDAFHGCTSLKTIRCEIEDVYFCEPGFSNYDATLYVPEGMTELYLTVEPWKNFKNVKEISSSDIVETFVNSDFGQIFFESEMPIKIWNLLGRIIYSGSSTTIPELNRGIYILECSDFSQKILIK
ncbi:MAG: leucine-rich repeat domain-containing protein [Lachnoclostridium sp.]|nr:leucine-rich repeat domain-containing protein [Lachnoclostridium sp.]